MDIRQRLTLTRGYGVADTNNPLVNQVDALIHLAKA